MNHEKKERLKGNVNASLRSFHFSGQCLDDILQPIDIDFCPASLIPRKQTKPEDRSLLPLESSAFLELYIDIVVGHRLAAVNTFRKQVAQLITLLNEQMALDRMHSPEGNSSKALTASMGAGINKYLDTETLARSLGEFRGSSQMSAERRERIQSTLKTLHEYMDNQGKEPGFVVVHSGELPADWNLPEHAVIHEEDSPAAARQLYDKAAREMLPVFRAVRTAQLEAKSEYDAALYDEAISRLNIQFLTANELQLVCEVIVVEQSGRLQNDLFPSFSQLLHSGDPIHVFVLHNALCLNQCDPAFAFRCVAHREAVVIQTTPLHPEHVARGLESMARTLRPAVMFMTGQCGHVDEEQSWPRLVAENLGRAAPCFHFAPGEGTTWADWFNLDANEQPEQTWPEVCIPPSESAGRSKEMKIHSTFADAIALDPEGAKHFRVIPDDAWNEEQVELSDYLETWITEPPKKIPFIWMADGKSAFHRAVLTRELALACRDRVRFWKMLQELGGVRSEFVRRAEERMRNQAEQDLENSRKEMKAAHEAEIEAVRLQTAEDTINRLVSVLLGQETTPLTSVPPPVAVAPAATESEDNKPSEVKEAAPQEPVIRVNPYIESALCTTCDECTKVNPKMFKYNADKQAYIADASAGTFAELVNAAIKCPSTCIHPGVPRPDDKTATEKLIAKAAEFN